MKESNLVSILQAYSNLPESDFEEYLDYYSIKIKKDELNDLRILFIELKTLTKSIGLFDKYFVGYSIPQIGKEFDLLRFGEKSIINIELKKGSTEDKIKKQLKKNKYYLSFLQKETHLFLYVSSTKKLYGLNDDGDLVELSLRELIAKIVSQTVVPLENIDALFNPTNYLVSPFNSTQKFILGDYFLTNHQDEIKKIILNDFKGTGFSFYGIQGKAGTGKTLLTYDIAKEIYKTKNVLLIHCGILNSGHRKLIDEYAWDIVIAKEIKTQTISKYDMIIVDEVQRIYPNQLDYLIEEVKKHSKSCIFSYDSSQTLRSNETKNDIGATIEKTVTKKAFELKTKIRTNKEVASFIQCLFNQNRPIELMNYSNISVSFFNGSLSVVAYLNFLRTEGWKVINYTPSSVHTLPYESFKISSEEDNPHTVIGQEFDKVVAVIDEYFYYDEGKLSTRNYSDKPYYHPTKMLFQIVSRTRVKLNIVILKNKDILKRCLEIVNKKST